MVLDESDLYARIKIVPAVLDFLNANGIFSTTAHGQSRWQVGQDLFIGKSVLLESHVGFYAGNVLCTAGSLSNISAALRPHNYGMTISFKRYCSVGTFIVASPRHPIEAVTANVMSYGRGHSIIRSALGDELASSRRLVASPQKAPPMIGNDVWVGTDVILNPGVTIGDGAVIAAGSAVVDDVAPYAIIGGNPAKFIKWRFDTGIIRDLCELAWWDYVPKDLAKFKLAEPRAFISEFSREAANLPKYTPRTIPLWTDLKPLLPP